MLVPSRDGAVISVAVSGDGPPLLLVHGTTTDRSSWSSVRRSLEPAFTVHAMDRRGRGESGDGPEYALEREFEDVAAVVAAIGGPVDVIGHSWGALCSLGAAPSAPGMARLVLFEPPIQTGDEPLVPPGVGEELQEAMRAGDGERVLLTFLREVARLSPSELELNRRSRSWAARVAMAHTVAREASRPAPYEIDPAVLGRLEPPVLLLTGALSPPPFRATIDALHAALRDSRVHVLPGQRHTAINAAPEMFARAVLGFLR
jgi:pimeloyl-ACP methyl ester carboxylesterase